MRALVATLALLLLAGCGNPEAGKSADGFAPARLAKPATPEMMDAEISAAAGDASAAAAEAPAPERASVPAGAPMLAYEYDFGVEAPASRVHGLATAHEKACIAAGPRQCQVASSSQFDGKEAGFNGARLKLRATAAWVQRFREGLPADAEGVGGRIVSSDVRSEDLSREIVDTEARLRAMTTLRDRLQALLATRPGKLSDLVEIERELARVQGEIDATTSTLAVMRGRVAMSAVSVDYRSEGTLAPRGVWSPLTSAFTDFIGIVSFTLAAMVRLIAWLAPWVLLIGGVVWLFRKRLPRWMRPGAAKAPPPETET